jgi:hypothetical protein
MNCTIFAALNQCSTTGYEIEICSQLVADSKQVKLFRDHKGWHRVVLFASDAPDSGLSGVIVQPDGEVYYKQTAKHAQGNNYTRQLQAMLTVWGIKWYASQWQTESGAACYKN